MKMVLLVAMLMTMMATESVVGAAGAPHCLDPQDQQAIMQPDFANITISCTTRCMFDVDPSLCDGSCLVEKASLTSACAECFGEELKCVIVCDFTDPNCVEACTKEFSVCAIESPSTNSLSHVVQQMVSRQAEFLTRNPTGSVVGAAGAPHCLDPQDQQAIMQPDFANITMSCTTRCIGDADPSLCDGSCLVEKASLTNECAECFGEELKCVIACDFTDPNCVEACTKELSVCAIESPSANSLSHALLQLVSHQAHILKRKSNASVVGVAGAGHCLDLQDQEAMMQPSFGNITGTCTTSCVFAVDPSSCEESCLVNKGSLTEPCAECFGEELKCVLACDRKDPNCVKECLKVLMACAVESPSASSLSHVVQQMVSHQAGIFKRKPIIGNGMVNIATK